MKKTKKVVVASGSGYDGFATIDDPWCGGGRR